MEFDIDKQTIKDLEIFDAAKNGKSIFDIFNRVECYGSVQKLKNYFSKPLTTSREINERKDSIAFFQSLDSENGLDINKYSLDFIENYLNQGNYPTKPPVRFFVLENHIKELIRPTNEYYIVERGVENVVELINYMYQFSLRLSEQACPALIQRNSEEVIRLSELPEFAPILKVKQRKKLKPFDIAKCDYMFRYTHKNQILFFLFLMYDYDIFINVGKVAAKYNFSYAEVSDEEKGIFVEGIFHPFIENPVQNNVAIVPEKNMLFLSGPNMAGKSTFMKALGVAVYLAHVGMPVPAANMRTCLLSGLATTINISDSLNLGYSHFYSEVQRIKTVAGKLKTNKMLVIFDELFRGTNVKDAHDGTIAVINAFLQVRNSFFAVSSHILEAMEVLSEQKKIDFRYFEITKQGNLPSYTYRLKPGISEDRLGMYIIEEERVVEMIKEIDN
jgi:DNA mismatch repair ATPase MutS